MLFTNLNLCRKCSNSLLSSGRAQHMPLPETSLHGIFQNVLVDCWFHMIAIAVHNYTMLLIDLQTLFLFLFKVNSVFAKKQENGG